MRRRGFAGAVVIALVGGALGVVGDISPAAAGPKPTITATGDAACQGSGKMKSLYGWINGSFSAVVAYKIVIGCGGSTGNPAVTVKKGKLSGLWQHTGNDCTMTDQFQMQIGWKGNGGRINPTSGVYSTTSVTANGWHFPGSGGTATVGGSWAAVDDSAGNVSGPSAAIQAACLAGPPAPGGKPPKPTKNNGFASISFTL